MSRETRPLAAESLAELRASDERLGRHAGEPEWLSNLRERAWASFQEQGIPTRRLEAWKSTSLVPLEAMEFARVGPASSSPSTPPGALPALAPTEAGQSLVFVDGVLDPARSPAGALPAGCRLTSLARARAESSGMLEGQLGRLAEPKRSALVGLQTAFLDDGAVLTIEPGVTLDAPLHLRFLSTGHAGEGPSAAFPRLLVVAGAGSRAAVGLEHDSIGEAAGLTAFVGELHLAAGASVELAQIQRESASRIHFTSLHARLERDARLDSHVFTLGGGLTRSELEVVLAEPGGEARLRGFFLGRGSGHVDHYTTVDHAAEHCTSDEEYRGVLDDHSHGIFRGRVIVRPDAQKTDARQSNPNLLISPGASVDAKPQLEIYADDVRASHGSTIGQLDPDALFFLRSRGIDSNHARRLLTHAFARAIIDGVATESLREIATDRVSTALAGLADGSTRDATEGAK
ncbi:MAG: Fe-S cluster assembly protein SufD [Deltaproteobacteria bacterium]|nr:Fe-S cluster assembly protein SufD [Deltaproteobacteria bacterium]